MMEGNPKRPMLGIFGICARFLNMAPQGIRPQPLSPLRYQYLIYCLLFNSTCFKVMFGSCRSRFYPMYQRHFSVEFLSCFKGYKLFLFFQWLMVKDNRSSVIVTCAVILQLGEVNFVHGDLCSRVMTSILCEQMVNADQEFIR